MKYTHSEAQQNPDSIELALYIRDYILDEYNGIDEFDLTWLHDAIENANIIKNAIDAYNGGAR